MLHYSPIEQLRSQKQFLHVEITPHDGHVNPKINSAYLIKGAVVFTMGVAAPALDYMGVSSLAVLCAQTLLVGVMVGQLSHRAVSNSKLKQLETAYILEHGTPDENQKLQDNTKNTQNYQSRKRVFLVASAILTGSMTVLEMANSGTSTILSNIVSGAAGLNLVSAGFMHLCDKLGGVDRGQLAHAIAHRRHETQSSPPGSPQKKAHF